MHRHVLLITLALFLPTTVAAAQEGAPAVEYEPAPPGEEVLESPTGLGIRVLVDAMALGGNEISMVEMTLPAGQPRIAGEHRHGAIEIFYILEGELDHIVNDESHRLQPGDVAILRPGDRVRHRVVSGGPVRALVIWVPGTELDGIRRALRRSGG